MASGLAPSVGYVIRLPAFLKITVKMLNIVCLIRVKMLLCGFTCAGLFQVWIQFILAGLYLL